MKKETIRKKKQLKNELHKKTRLPKAEEQKIPDYLAEIKDKGNFSKKNKIIIFGIIIILSFILYGNTIPFGYVFDDPIVITQNNFTKSGISGIPKMLSTDSFAGIFGEHGGIIAGGRYRPLSLITFAIEYEFFGEFPELTHSINIILYAVSCIIVFLILAKMFSSKGIYKVKWLPDFSRNKWYLSIPFIAALFFIAHPIHTEVVANIKERDDIMALLGASLALFFSLKYLEKGKKSNLIWSGLSFFLGLMSKENTVTYFAIIPLTAYFFTNKKIKNIALTLLPVSIALIVFMILRTKMLGEAANNNIPNKLMNDPFLYAKNGEKFATIIYTLWLYIKLMFYPNPLTVDYYPFHIPVIGWTDFRAWASLLFYLFLGFMSFKWLKKRSIFTYTFWFFVATLSLFSNIFFPIGTFMTERFLYIPVLGFCIWFAYLISHYIPQTINKKKQFKGVKYKLFVSSISLIIILLYSRKTISRNFDWKDDFTLFSQAAKHSPGSAKSNHVLGELYMLKARKEKDKAVRDSLLDLSIKYSKKGVEIHPKYIRCLHNLGAAIIERDSKNYEEAFKYFVEAIKNQPYYIETHRYIKLIFNNKNFNMPLDFKIKNYEEIYKYATNHYHINSSLGTMYLMKNNFKKAEFFLDRAVRIQVEDNKAIDYNNLGVLYFRQNKMEEAIKWFEKAVRAAPENLSYLRNLGNIYQHTKQMEKAQKIYQKFEEVKNKQKKDK